MASKVCDMVAERILEQLEKGVAPWHCPWSLVGASVSHKDGRRYSLLNQFLLGEAGEYITFKQCEAEHGQVKKGAKSKFVVYWNFVKKEEEDEVTHEKKISSYPILMYYRVFNVNDCEGIETKFFKTGVEIPHDVVSEAEDVIDGYLVRNPELKVSREGMSNEAYYCPATDEVVVPKKEQYEEIEEFYSTLFHELTHSTGSKSRLNRFTGKSQKFGSGDYSFEELIAETGAAMLAAHCGIDTEKTFDNSAAYIDSWKKHIKEGSSMTLVSAFGKAEKAFDFILNGKKEEEAAA